MYGPSGTGKTLLAKATAGEAGVNFISATGSEFVEMYVGLGARRVRDIFKQARKNAPCILFIDEIEGIAIKRMSSYEKSSMEYHSTLNQLLTEMDGFKETENIVVIGATNKQDMLDEAIVRPGRLDWKIFVDLPDQDTRFEILQLHLSKRSNSVDDEILRKVAQNTETFSGADLEHLINEASFESVRAQKSSVTNEEIVKAFRAAKETKAVFRTQDTSFKSSLFKFR
jgi:cell division protease FtsH